MNGVVATTVALATAVSMVMQVPQMNADGTITNVPMTFTQEQMDNAEKQFSNPDMGVYVEEPAYTYKTWWSTLYGLYLKYSNGDEENKKFKTPEERDEYLRKKNEESNSGRYITDVEEKDVKEKYRKKSESKSY